MLQSNPIHNSKRITMSLKHLNENYGWHIMKTTNIYRISSVSSYLASRDKKRTASSRFVHEQPMFDKKAKVNHIVLVWKT